MRFKMLILSSLLFIAFLAVTALCVNWDDPSGNAEEMISGGEVGDYYGAGRAGSNSQAVAKKAQ